MPFETPSRVTQTPPAQAIEQTYLIARQAIWSGDCCTWTGDGYVREGGDWRHVHRALDGSFDDGSAGIACCLARAYVASGDRLIRSVMRGALRHALGHVDAWLAEGRVGAYSGVAGLARACLTVGSVIGEEQWLEQADQLMQALALPCLRLTAGDWLNGRAGLAVLYLHWPRTLRQIDRLAQATRLLDPLARCQWPAHPGLAHGRAGVALAMAELRRQGGQALRPLPPEPTSGAVAPAWPGSDAWCKGSAGLLLAQTHGAGSAVPMVPQETALAALLLRTREALALADADLGLCHGAAGTLDVLLICARRLRRPELYAATLAVQQRLQACLARSSRERPTYAGFGTPGLMLGLAGVLDLQLRVAQGAHESPLLL